jgi:hypothetical protein
VRIVAIVGHVDAASPKGFSGWVYDTADPLVRLTLEWRDPRGGLENYVADQLRPDIARAGRSDGGCGFEVRFREPIPAEHAARMKIRVRDTDYVFALRVGPPCFKEAPTEVYRRIAEEARAAGRNWQKFRHCYLHIGAEKTGSTSLQAWLAENEAALSQHGVSLSRALLSERGAGVLNNVKLAAIAFSDARMQDDMRASLGIVDAASLHKAREQTFREFLDEVSARPEGAHTLILSNEHCHSRLFSEVDVANLKAFLDPFCESYTVIAYLRPQFELAVSQYGMIVANGMHDIEMFPPMPPPPGYKHRIYTQQAYFDYAAMLSRWATVFGEGHIQPRLFQRNALRDGDVVADFLSLLAIETPIGPRRSLNTNLSAKGLAFLAAFHSQFGGSEGQGARLIRERMRNAAQAAFPGAGPKPGRAEAEAFMARFAAGNESLRARWFPDRTRLFDLDLDKLPETTETVTLGAAELMTAFVEVLKKDQELGFSLTPAQASALATGTRP